MFLLYSFIVDFCKNSIQTRFCFAIIFLGDFRAHQFILDFSNGPFTDLAIDLPGKPLIDHIALYSFKNAIRFFPHILATDKAKKRV